VDFTQILKKPGNKIFFLIAWGFNILCFVLIFRYSESSFDDQSGMIRRRNDILVEMSGLVGVSHFLKM